MTERKLRLIASLLCLSLCTCGRALYAQSNGQALIVLYGTVTETNGEPLPYATITARPPGKSIILTYTTTGNDGRFRLTLDSLQAVDLLTRYVGKETDTLRLRPPFDDQPLSIQLQPSDNDLPSIEVTTDRRPITINNDTTTYNVATFRDSLDRSIEDVLRKMPGVEVGENGAIKFRGKDIETILIEDSDMFGMDYQLASKNIRARDIGTVEAIDHYQEDMVLSDVNTSDAVVLNLKLNDDKRSVVAGEIMGQLGPGTTATKYQLYAPLYRISRKHKSFFLGNVDNLAAKMGISYDGLIVADQRGSLRSPLFRENGFHDAPQVLTGGLPELFTDNTARLNVQLREHYTFKKSKLFVQLGGDRWAGSQRKGLRREFLGEGQTYTLSSNTNWAKRGSILGGEAEYNYTATDRTFSLRVYGKVGQGQRSFDRVATGIAAATDTLRRRTNGQLYRAILSKKIASGAVLQWTVAYQNDRSNERSVFRQADLRLLPGGAADSVLRQGIDYRHYRLHTEAAVMRKFGKVTLRSGLFGTREVGQFAGPLQVEQGANAFGLTDFGPFARLVLARGKWRHRVNLQYRLTGQGLDRYDYNWRSDKYITVSNVFSVQLLQEQTLPDLRYLLDGAEYLSGPFTYVLGSRARTQVRRRLLSVGYRFDSGYKLTDGFLRLAAEQRTNGLTEALDFIGNLNLTRPVAGADSWSVTGSGGYSLFSMALKSEIEGRAIIRYAGGEYQLGEQAIRYRNINYRVSGSSSWKINRTFRIKLQVNGSYLQSFDGVQFDNLAWRVTPQLITRLAGSHLFVGLFTAGNNGSRSQNRLLNGYLGGQKSFTAHGREYTVDAKIYNPLDRRRFATQAVDPLFINETSVGTVGAFGFISFGMGL